MLKELSCCVRMKKQELFFPSVYTPLVVGTTIVQGEGEGVLSHCGGELIYQLWWEGINFSRIRTDSCKQPVVILC